MIEPSIERTIDTVWRIEPARIIAGLAHRTGEIDLAEDGACAGGPTADA